MRKSIQVVVLLLFIGAVYSFTNRQSKVHFELFRSQAITDTSTRYFSQTSELRSNTIPPEVFTMINLEHLDITGMDCDMGGGSCWMIKEIPKEIGNLKNLKTISLRINAIQTIPIEIGQLTKLESLDLTDNPGLSNINNVVLLKNLKILTLFGCSIHKLPNNIGQLVNLKYLGLAGNQIEKPEQERIKHALPNCEIIL